MKHPSIQFQYNIFLSKSSDILPYRLHFLNPDQYPKIKEIANKKPLKYYSDFLTAAYLVQINPYLKSPLIQKSIDFDSLHQIVQRLDPYWEVYNNAKTRLEKNDITHPPLQPPEETVVAFENHIAGLLQKAFPVEGCLFAELTQILTAIDDLESQIKKPLLYNLHLQLSHSNRDKLHKLYLFLWHLRSVVATDYNSHIEDSTFEAVRMDSINDYLPKADYVVNDALVYLNFKKLTAPFIKKRKQNSDDPHFADLVVRPLDKIFQKYNYAGYCLSQIISLEAQQKALASAEFEENLYRLQMDWLLGSDAGLLFKIREELFALQWGYAKVFWHEAMNLTDSLYAKKETRLHVNTQLSLDVSNPNAA